MDPWGKLYTENLEEAKVCVMGIPFDGGASSRKGTAQAPERIRSLSDHLHPYTETGVRIDKVKVYDAGDVPVDLNWERYYAAVENKAFDFFQTENFCLFLGGDHSVTIPLHKAFGRYCKESGKQKIGVIQLDSHYDLCDEYAGHKWSHACTERRALEWVIQPRDLSFAGIRSFEEPESEFIAENPEILVITAYDIFSAGWKSACEHLVRRYQGYDAVYLSVDIDFLDPAWAPGTGTPEACGPSLRELVEIVKELLRNIRITAMDIVEVSPPWDVNDMTTLAALKVVYEVFGVLNEG